MPKERILIVDDDPDILDILDITLTQEGYEVIKANDGQEALEKISREAPHLVILDYKMPKIDGREVLRQLKKDILLRHLPTIMLTAKAEIQDKVGGIEAGADDYMVKPFEPEELLARVRMILRRSIRDLDANPLTKLPGNVSIIKEITDRLSKALPLAVCYLDLDKFKAYNDSYGFEKGDEVIKETARIILNAVDKKANKDDFVGHIGGDDFVIVTTPQITDDLCTEIIINFDKKIPEFYKKEDRKRGYIISKDRKGEIQKFPIMTVSIGVVTNEQRKLKHVGQISALGAELKHYAKSFVGSNYSKDRRIPPKS